jgi:uncharacterized phage protein (TIGR02220 family)
MAKRFTDTELWDKEWFMQLPPRLKCLVKMVRDKCDLSGIWSPNWAIANAYIGEAVSEKELLAIDGGDQFVKISGGKIVCVDFVRFQYGQLSEKSPVHRKVISMLKAQNIDYQYPIYRVQDKEEEKEEDKDKEEDKEKEEEEENADPVFLNQVKFIISDLNQKCNTEYRPSSKKTQELIRARMREGFVLTDFEYVNSVKALEWLNSDQEKYLRPETLYGSKFEGYKNQKLNVTGNSKTGTGRGGQATDQELAAAVIARHTPAAGS